MNRPRRSAGRIRIRRGGRFERRVIAGRLRERCATERDCIDRWKRRRRDLERLSIGCGLRRARVITLECGHGWSLG
jgi:hypothetical protein